MTALLWQWSTQNTSPTSTRANPAILESTITSNTTEPVVIGASNGNLQNIQVVYRLKCNKDAFILKQFVEKDRIYNFLAGLNVEFDVVHVQTLGRKELPSLNGAIAVLAEEGRTSVMIELQPIKSLVLVSKNTVQHFDGNNGQPGLSK